jgi:hypothetical protein
MTDLCAERKARRGPLGCFYPAVSLIRDGRNSVMFRTLHKSAEIDTTIIQEYSPARLESARLSGRATNLLESNQEKST